MADVSSPLKGDEGLIRQLILADFRQRLATGCVITSALCAVFVSAIPLDAADWSTFGHDPQRSGWAFEETSLTPQNVGQIELKWKSQVKNEPRSLTALTAPLAASDVVTPQGVKTLVYVAGSAD